MASLASILEFPHHRIQKLHSHKLERGVVKMIRKVRPDWPKDDIILEKFTAGFSNIIIGGYINNRSEMILVKIYGNETEDKTSEILSMRIFAALRFGSRIFATFANGYVYEYTPGVALTYELCIDPNVYPLVARRIGQLHRELERHFPDPIPGNGHVFETLREWLRQVPTHLSDPDDNARMKRELPSKQALDRELSELEHKLSHEPLIFCHGDLNPSNLIFDPVSRTIVLIDLEFAGCNFQAFEIAQHFMTFASNDMDKVGKDEFVPAREFQLRWCHAYLAAFWGVSPKEISPKDVEVLWLQVQKFSLVYCLQEIIWDVQNYCSDVSI